MLNESLSTPTHSPISAGPTLGFGMLRVDPAHGDHRTAVRDALRAGVALYDLGDFALDPSRFIEKRNLLLGLVAEYATARVRVLVRGNLGAATGAESVCAPDGRIEWIYLIADPEFALPSLDWDHARLYSRIGEELDQLENLAERGVITSYGIGSAGLTYAKESSDALALAPLVFGGDLAWESSAQARPANRHHFGWIEFPLNLIESEAVMEPTQRFGDRDHTLLEAARELGLGTIARRPFDAMSSIGLRRLVSYPDHHKLDLHEAVRLTLQNALAAEGEFLARRNHDRLQAGETASTLDPLWAHRLRDQLKHVTDPEQWKEIRRRKIDPDLAEIRRRGEVDETPEGSRYLESMKALLLSVQLWCEKTAAERNERLRARLVEASPTLGRKRHAEDRDLALLSLRIYRSIPGLTSILIGMRSPLHVQSITQSYARLAAEPPLEEKETEAVLIAAHSEVTKGSL